MGKLAKKAAEYINTFRPVDLNESNVSTIFERCLAKAGDDITSKMFCRLLYQENGFSDVDTPIEFNEKAIETNKRNILYLLGQLEKSHNHNNGASFEYSLASIKYDGTQWTVSPATLSKLFYLGFATKVAGFFRKINDETFVDISAPVFVKKTLSPNDPNFATWWAEHKAEWE